jgi:hypothetical protein
MGATYDPELLQETFNFIKNKSRDQDIIYFFRGLSDNIKMRRGLAAYIKDQYDIVSNLISLIAKILNDGSAHQTFWRQLHYAISYHGLWPTRQQFDWMRDH